MGSISTFLHGFYNGFWRKLSLLFGFDDTLNFSYSESNVAAGASSVTIFTMPANKIGVILNMGFYYLGTVPASIVVQNNDSSYVFSPWAWLTPVTAKRYSFPCFIILKPGQTLTLILENGTAGNDVQITGHGFSMDITR